VALTVTEELVAAHGRMMEQVDGYVNEDHDRKKHPGLIAIGTHPVLFEDGSCWIWCDECGMKRELARG